MFGAYRFTKVIPKLLMVAVRMKTRPLGSTSKEWRVKDIESRTDIITPIHLESVLAKKIWGNFGWEHLGGLEAIKCVSWTQIMSHLAESASFHKSDLLKGLLSPFSFKGNTLNDMSIYEGVISVPIVIISIE